MNIRRNLVELSQYIEVFGWTSGVKIFSKIKFNSADRLKLKGVQYPIKLRSGSSDINAFRQVFLYREYNFETKEPQFIIDGGSNIGLAAIYFANKFPKATIVSIGKKYFYIDERKRDKIEISSMQMITYNGMGVKLYTSKQDILDGIERTKLFDAISKQFQWVNSNKFTLEQLRQIDQILTP